MSNRPTTRSIEICAIACLMLAIGFCTGCNSKGQPVLPGISPNQQQLGLTPDVIRNQVEAFADRLVAQTTQACDELQKPGEPTDIRVWAQGYKVGTMATAYAYATGENPAVSMLDMLIFVTLKRRALENHWIPTLLHEKGDNVLRVYKQNESDIWDLTGKVLTPEQITELKVLIDKWLADHPKEYVVALVRFGDFTTAYGTKGQSGGGGPSSIFGLLYLDPLSNLDSVTQQAKSIQLLSERLMYLIGRYPFLINAQVQWAIMQAGESPAAVKALDATTQFSGATAEFANTVKGFPNYLSGEREAAVKQILAGVDQQRMALINDVNNQTGQIQKVIQDTNNTIAQTKDASQAILGTANKTVELTEASSRRLLNYFFKLSIAFVLITVVSITIAMLLYNRLKYRKDANPSGGR